MGGEPRQPQPGDTIAGKYRVERVLGEGGMGLVFEATHLRLRQPCAIKMLLPAALANTEYIARFEREAQVAATLRDPHVVQVLDVDTTSDGLPYMVMELLRGHDLADEISARGPLPIDEAAGHAFTVCVTLAHAHEKRIIHRDLKPSNLFLAEDGDRRILKLLDFGISKLNREGEGHITSSASIFGTPFYMSPEQVRNVRTVDSRSDLWSLGVVLYEMLTGQVPFRGTPTAVVASIVADPIGPPTALRRQIPDELERVVMKALQKDVDLRFASASEMAAALEPFAGETTKPARRRVSSARVSVAGVRAGDAPASPRRPPSDFAYAATQDLSSGKQVAAAPEPVEGSDTVVEAGASPSEPRPNGDAEKSPTVNKTAWSRPPPAPVTTASRKKRVVGVVFLAAAAAAAGIITVRSREHGTTTTSTTTTPAAVGSASDPGPVASAAIAPPVVPTVLAPASANASAAPSVTAVVAITSTSKTTSSTATPTKTKTTAPAPGPTTAPAKETTTSAPPPAAVAPAAPVDPGSRAKANPLTL